MKSNTVIYDKYVRYLLVSSTILVALIIAAIIIFVGQQGLQTFTEVNPLEFFTGLNWDPTQDRYGALSFIMGSVYITLISVVIATPLGVLTALFMTKVAPPWIKSIMKPAMDLYVAIPSVVYGYLGLIILVPFIQETFDVPSGFGLLAAGLVLSIMILPTIISLSCDAISTVPPSLSEASIALGATQWQTMYKIIIPSAASGILTGVVLAMARAVGETMAVQMLIGNTPLLATSLLMPTSTLTSNIVVEMGNTSFGSTWNHALFLMALVLLIISLILILCIRKISERRAIR